MFPQARDAGSQLPVHCCISILHFDSPMFSFATVFQALETSFHKASSQVEQHCSSVFIIQNTLHTYIKLLYSVGLPNT